MRFPTEKVKASGKHRPSARMRRRHLQNWLLVSPQLFLFILLTIVPLFVGLPVVFTNRSSWLDPHVDYVGFDNFTLIFRDKILAAEYVPALVRTARFTAFAYVCVVLIGLTLALLMFEIGFRGELFTMIYMPYIVSGMALGTIALGLFSQETGSINLLLKKLGWIEKSINIKSEGGTTIALPILIAWQYAGWNMALFLSGLLSIPKETIEASVVDGASYLQRLFRIYFPQIIPAYVMVTVFALTGLFQTFQHLIPLGALSGNDAAEFLSVIFYRYGFSAGKMALGLALSIETFVPLMIIVILLMRWQRKASYEV